MKFLLRGTLCLTVAAALAASQAVAADAPPPSSVPVEAFFNTGDMSQPVLSPDGDALAILLRSKTGRRELAILETADAHKAHVVAAFSDADIINVHWVNDKRLVFQSGDEAASAFDQRGSGLFAVDRDGSAMRGLIRAQWTSFQTGSNIKSRELEPDHKLLRTLDDGSDDVLVKHLLFHDGEPEGSAPLRLDTRTGIARAALPGRLPDHVFGWFFDGQGHLVAAETENAGENTLLTQDGDGWRERTRFPTYGLSPGSFEIEEVAANGRVYVTSNEHRDAHALYRLDPTTFKPEPEAVVKIDGFDFDGKLIEDTRRHQVLGVHYVSDAGGTAWLDPELKQLQARIDARLPGLINTVDIAPCGCASRVLVTSSSDRQPRLYFLYDRSDDSLIGIGAAHPDISAGQMAMTDFFRIKARDGHEIPVYVTRPHGKGPWPTVVLVHGGPEIRGWEWKWDAESQFLASRGYLVVKPEFRGSAGYGSRLFIAGFKQWGLASQDDIADATTWAASQNLADPKRTCIAGASYGGYATLMGLVRYGDLYRCGVAWSAVADIGMMYDIWWSDFSDQWKGYGMPVMVGDKVKDAAQFEATSPLKQAARITRPLLLAHGGVDHRVPIEQAFAMRDALRANHAPLTWIEYPGEGHGWSKPETRADFYKRMEAFLAANIGPGAEAAKP